MHKRICPKIISVKSVPLFQTSLDPPPLSANFFPLVFPSAMGGRYPPFPLICFPLDFRKSPSAMGGIWFECSKIPVTMATEEDQLFSLCCIRQFLPQMIWMFGIPATMVDLTFVNRLLKKGEQHRAIWDWAKPWKNGYGTTPPTVLPRFVEIGIGKPCQTGRLVWPINNFFFRILRSELIVKKLNQSKVSNTGSVHYTLQADIQLTGIQL